MEYTESMGDMYMTYNGTPEEIFRLISLKDNEEMQTIDDVDVINYVHNITQLTKCSIQSVLDAELGYLRLQGIAE